MLTRLIVTALVVTSIAISAIALAQTCPQAQDFARGVCFYSKKDYQQAVPLIRAAAERRNRSAMMLLSNMYSFGEGVPRDNDAAIVWAERAFANGERSSATAIATLYLTGKGDPPKYITWLSVAASENNSGAMVLLGDFYGDGMFREYLDPCLADYWYFRSTIAAQKTKGSLSQDTKRKWDTAKAQCHSRNTPSSK